MCLPTSLKCTANSICWKPKLWSSPPNLDCFLPQRMELTSTKLCKPRAWIHPWNLPLLQPCHIQSVTKLYKLWNLFLFLYLYYQPCRPAYHHLVAGLQNALYLIYLNSLCPPPIQLYILFRCSLPLPSHPYYSPVKTFHWLAIALRIKTKQLIWFTTP